jgi:predicted dehydrogenase
MIDRLSRRDFIRAAIAAGTMVPAAGAIAPAVARAAEPRSANEKLNFGVIGVAARGADDLAGVSSQNIVALCDIDASRLAGAAAKFPKAATYDDFRRVFDHKDLDGVVIATPDHMHAICISWALRRGLAVYCEKPLVHSVFEAQYIRKLVQETKCVTQMGNQIHNHESNNYRRCVEIVQAGVIGPVNRVQIWMPAVDHFEPGKRVASAEVPAGISYDNWIGPAPFRPFHPSHFHFKWRSWWDFGGGQLADFWCHYADLAFWALDLKHPTRVHAIGEKGHDGDTDVPRHMQVEYEFPARGDKPPVHLTWSHGSYVPPEAKEYKLGAAVLFEGEKGRLLADYTTHKLFMQQGAEAGPAKPTIPDTIGHYAEFIEAVRAKNLNTTCNFVYGSTLTESGLLGNCSYRSGQKALDWDAAEMKFTNDASANAFLQREYRQGWALA